jgi:hypothetical protein
MSRIAGIVLAGLLLSTAAWWIGPDRAYACSCTAELTDTQHAADADVVFTGQIVAEGVRRQRRTLTFAVEEVFKGEAARTEVLTTASMSSACGLGIHGPGHFLVFADRDPDEPGSLIAGSCGGTRAGDAPASLGEGHQPLPDPATTTPSLRLPMVISLGLAALLAGGILGFLVGRRRRPAG